MRERGHPLSAVTQITRKAVVGRDISHEPGNEQSMLNEVNIDFRIPGLTHSVVKQAQNSRVRELAKKIENPLHRHVLQRNLQQNRAYNPFSTTTKQMIQDVGNVELFELFETDPQTQWTEIVSCACWHLWKERNRGQMKFHWIHIDWTFFQFLNTYKKGRPRGHKYGKTPEKKEYHLAHLKKRCIKRRFTGIHHRFFRDHDFRKCMLDHDRDEDVCLKLDHLAIYLQQKRINSWKPFVWVFTKDL